MNFLQNFAINLSIVVIVLGFSLGASKAGVTPLCDSGDEAIVVDPSESTCVVSSFSGEKYALDPFSIRRDPGMSDPASAYYSSTWRIQLPSEAPGSSTFRDSRPVARINTWNAFHGPTQPYGSNSNYNPLGLDPNWYDHDLCIDAMGNEVEPGQTPSSSAVWLLNRLNAAYDQGYRRMILTWPAGDPFGLAKRASSAQWWTMPAWKRDIFINDVTDWINEKNNPSSGPTPPAEEMVSVGIYVGSWINWRQPDVWDLTNGICDETDPGPTDPDSSPTDEWSFADPYSFNMPNREGPMITGYDRFPQTDEMHADFDRDMDYMSANIKPWLALTGIREYWFDQVTPTLQNPNDDPEDTDFIRLQYLAYMNHGNERLQYDSDLDGTVDMKFGGETFPTLEVMGERVLREEFFDWNPWVLKHEIYECASFQAKEAIDEAIMNGFVVADNEIGIIFDAKCQECPSSGKSIPDIQEIYSLVEQGFVAWASGNKARGIMARVYGLVNDLTCPATYAAYTANPTAYEDWAEFVADFDGSGQISVQDAGLFLLNFDSTPPTTTFASNYLWGDINFDGNVDSDDVNLFGAVLAAFHTYVTGDTNGDSEVDDDDLMFVLNHLDESVDRCDILSNVASDQAKADVNGDGIVSGADYTVVLVNWTGR